MALFYNLFSLAVLFFILTGHEMQDCQGTARPMDGDEYKVTKGLRLSLHPIIWILYYLTKNLNLLLTGRWGHVWRGSKVYIRSAFCVTWIPQKRSCNAKSSVSLWFWTGYRWLGFHVLFRWKWLPTSSSKVWNIYDFESLNIAKFRRKVLYLQNNLHK